MDEYKITKVKKIKCINKVLIELNTLLNFYLNKKNSIKKINDRLIFLAKKDRNLFGKFFDAAQCLPSLHALSDSLLDDIRKIYKFKIIQIADFPKLRLDLPEKNSKHNDPWHQEAMAYDAPRDSITAWLPLVNMRKDVGRLEIKGETKKIGLLKHSLYKKKPYIRVNKGDWEKLPSLKFYVPYGSFIAFNNAVPHKSSKNISKNKVRISVQVRYNFLDNSIYKKENYKPTVPKAQSVQEVYGFEKNRQFKI